MKDEKSRTSNEWFLRVDGDYESLKKYSEKFINQIDVIRCIAYYHTGEKKENPHMHMCITVRTVTQKQSFALRVKQCYENIEKKSQYALAVWDGNSTKGAVSYMFHEKEVKQIVCKGFSEEEVNGAMEANESVQKVVAINKEKAANKLVECAIDQFSEQKCIDKFEILKYMLKRIKEGENYHPGMYKLKQYVEEVQIRISSSEQFDSICVEVYRDLFR